MPLSRSTAFRDTNPASILYKSIAARYRPVSYPDGPITPRYRFIKNAYWERSKWGTHNDKTNATYETTDAQTEELQQKSHLRTVSRNTTLCVFKLDILTRNLALNSDAVLNYKHMFDPLRRPLHHLWNIQWNTYNQRDCDETKQRTQWRSKASAQDTVSF